MAFKRGNGLNNVLNGTAGIDVLLGLDGADTLNGLPGGDILVSGDESDRLAGGGGNDFIIADQDRDTVDGGGGNDFVFSSLYQPGEGPKDQPSVPALRQAHGGAGEDFLYLNAIGAQVELAFRFGAAAPQQLPGQATVSGFEGGFIVGTQGPFGDTLQAAGFRLDGPAAPLATLNSGLAQMPAGIDKQGLQAAAGASLLLAHFNGFSGEGGSDRLTALLDTDGGPITRGLRFDGGDRNDTLSLSITQDALAALADADNLFNVRGLGGVSQQVPVVEVSGGDDILGFDDDLFILRLPANLARRIDIAAPNANGVQLVKAAGDTILRAVNIDRWDLKLGSGRDKVSLGEGGDTVLGGAGPDTLSGLAGNDVLGGGAGADRLNGGEGTDTARFVPAVAVDVLHPVQSVGEAKGDTFLSIEAFQFGNGADTFLGGNQGETALGGAGADLLRGNGGNDTLVGGPGADTMAGAAGADAFRFIRPTEGIDRINGFVSGEDKLQIAVTTFSGALFTLIEASNPIAPPFTPSFLYDTDDGRLSFDVDGQGGTLARHFATLVGAPDLNVGDFAYFF